MCIRDSNGLVRRIEADDDWFFYGRREIPSDSRDFVSHLLLSLIHISEPHETVLDLVCRLLLEKKKHTKYNIITLD